MILRTVLNGIYFSGMNTLCSPALQGVGSILMLHRVRDEINAEFAPNSGLAITPDFLDITINRLKQEGYRFVSLDELTTALKSGEFEVGVRPMICVTLDDGYKDNLENAVPIFKRHKIPFMIYIAPKMVGGDSPIWWEDLEIIIAEANRIEIKSTLGSRTFDTSTLVAKEKAYQDLMTFLTREVSEEEQREIIRDLSLAHGHDQQAYASSQIMDWSELAALSDEPLCTLGAHTMGHFAVARLGKEKAEEEISKSREVLQEKIGKPVEHFAYPYGYPSAAGPRDFEIARNLGFKSAVTTRHGVIYPEHTGHMTALPRISLNGSYQAVRYVRTLLSGVTTRINNRGKRLNVA